MFNRYQLFCSSLIGASLLGTITLAATTLQGPPKKSVPAAMQEVKNIKQTPIELTPTAFNLNYDPSAVVAPSDEGGIAGPGCPCTDTENETSCAIPDTVNGGCNSSPPVFSTVACGQTVCGATWANTTNRDTDWWNFTITGPSIVTWTVTGNFTPLIGFIATPCPQSAFITSTTGTACTATTLTTTLAAGTYSAFVANSAFVAIPCPSQYSATLTCLPLGACCLSPTSCQATTQSNCATLGGSFLGTGTSCPVSAYNAATCSNTLEDISTTGTLSTVTGTDDGSQTGVPIGFTFNHYGSPFTTISINNNGFLSFDSIAAGFFTNAAIPNTATPNNLIAPLWDDLDSRTAGCTVHYQTLASPSRFIVQWTNMQRFPQTGGPNTFQAILYATGDIEFRYGAIEGTPTLTPSVGVENAGGTAGTSIDPTTLGTGNTCRHLTFVPGALCVACPADINGDHTVGVADLLTVISAWGPCPAPPAPCPADLNHDGTVGVADLLTVISSWGACP